MRHDLRNREAGDRARPCRRVLRRTPRELPKNTHAATTVIAEKVRATDGCISAKRLLPLARTAGYTGSARNFRRAVAEAKKAWRRRATRLLT